MINKHRIVLNRDDEKKCVQADDIKTFVKKYLAYYSQDRIAMIDAYIICKGYKNQQCLYLLHKNYTAFVQQP